MRLKSIILILLMWFTCSLRAQVVTNPDDIHNQINSWIVPSGNISAQKLNTILNNIVNSYAQAGVQTTTYNNLTTLINNSQLSPGSAYLIQDYKTTYTQPVTNIAMTGPVEPLIVQATSTNQLSAIAASATYPQDVVYFDINNDQGMVPGCTMGYIYRRIDTKKNIDIGFDWRTVLFRRWSIDANAIPTFAAESNYSKYAVIKDQYGLFYLNNLDNNNDDDMSANDGNDFTYLGNITGNNISPTPDNLVFNQGLYGGSFSLPVDDNTYGDYTIFGNNALDNIYDITIKQNYQDIINQSNTVIFDQSVEKINIGLSFTNNTIISAFINVRARNFFSNNIIDYVSQSDFGLNFSNNLLSGAEVNNTTFGDFVVYNVFAGYADYSTIGSRFSNNIFSNTENSTIGDDAYLSVAADFKDCILSRESSNNRFGGAYQSKFGEAFMNNSFTNINITTFGDQCNYNTGTYLDDDVFGLNCQNNSFNALSDHNRFGDNFSYNTSVGYSAYNRFGNNNQSNNFGMMLQNSFGDNSQGNNIGDNFNYNTATSHFQGNTIATYCFNNNFGFNFTGNSISDYFGYNNITTDFQGNTIGTNCNNNTIALAFTSNVIGNYCQDSKFDGYVQDNNIGDYFQNNTVAKAFQNNTVYSNTFNCQWLCPYVNFQSTGGYNQILNTCSNENVSGLSANYIDLNSGSINGANYISTQSLSLSYLYFGRSGTPNVLGYVLTDEDGSGSFAPKPLPQAVYAGETQSASGGQTTFYLGSTPSGSAQMFVNGNIISPSQYSVSSNTLTYSGSSISSGATVIFFYIHY